MSAYATAPSASFGALPSDQIRDACLKALDDIKMGRELALNIMTRPHMKAGLFSKSKTRKEAVACLSKIELEIVEFHRLIEEHRVRMILSMARAVDSSAKGMLMNISAEDFYLLTDFYEE